jgi:acetyl-CoA carboxylase carboxyltransferase component
VSDETGDVRARVRNEAERIRRGGAARYHERLREQGKRFVRERLRLLFDAEPEVEDGLFARADDPELPADAVVTGLGRIDGRPVAFMAADSTVKAGSWGALTVEKILRIQETAERLSIPIVYLVDSAGARITDQVAMFPGRRHAGRIFFNQVRLSGRVPQAAILFGPSPAGAAYVPAFCDLVIMVDKNANASLGSPRMAEMVIGERVSLEEMGGARMHCTKSGLGDVLAADEVEAIAALRRYLSYMPANWRDPPPAAPPRPPKAGPSLAEVVPSDQNRPFDMREVVDRIVDEGSWFEVKELFAPELLTGFARIAGRPVGIVANQSKVRGGTLFVDSADKGARFIWLANAFGIPLVFLCDVPGFMIGSRVEQQGIIRHGAKMVAAVSEATVPKLCVIVRKCYGAGLYAMAGPAFDPDATIALPTAQVAVMGPQAAVNAVYANKIQALPDSERAKFVAAREAEYRADIDVLRLAGEGVLDHVVDFDDLRPEVERRLALYATKERVWPARHNAVHPV